MVLAGAVGNSSAAERHSGADRWMYPFEPHHLADRCYRVHDSHDVGQDRCDHEEGRDDATMVGVAATAPATEPGVSSAVTTALESSAWGGAAAAVIS